MKQSKAKQNGTNEIATFWIKATICWNHIFHPKMVCRGGALYTIIHYTISPNPCIYIRIYTPLIELVIIYVEAMHHQPPGCSIGVATGIPTARDNPTNLILTLYRH